MNWSDLLNILIGVIIGSVFSYFIMKRSSKDNKELEITKRKHEYCDSLVSLLGKYYAGIEDCKALFVSYKQATYIARETKDPGYKRSAVDLESKYESCRTQARIISSSIEMKLLLVNDGSNITIIADKIKKCLNDIDSYFSPSSKNLEGLDSRIQDLRDLSQEFIKNYK